MVRLSSMSPFTGEPCLLLDTKTKVTSLAAVWAEVLLATALLPLLWGDSGLPHLNGQRDLLTVILS